MVDEIILRIKMCRWALRKTARSNNETLLVNRLVFPFKLIYILICDSEICPYVEISLLNIRTHEDIFLSSFECRYNSFIQYSVWRQVQSLLQNDSSTIVRSRASSFKWQYPLLYLRSSSSFLRLIPRLLITSISSFIFPSITCFRRQFLCKMWPIQLAFRFLISCRIFLCSLTLSNTYSFLTWSVQLICILLQHRISFQNFPFAIIWIKIVSYLWRGTTLLWVFIWSQRQGYLYFVLNLLQLFRSNLLPSSSGSSQKSAPGPHSEPDSLSQRFHSHLLFKSM